MVPRPPLPSRRNEKDTADGSARPEEVTSPANTRASFLFCPLCAEVICEATDRCPRCRRPICSTCSD